MKENNIINESETNTESNLEEYLIQDKGEDKNNIEQDMYAVFINNPLFNDQNEKNKTDTSKYRWFNFLSKILMEQFSRLVNVYFLIIAVLQSIKEVTYTGGSPINILNKR